MSEFELEGRAEAEDGEPKAAPVPALPEAHHEGVRGARRVARVPAIGPTLVSIWRARIALRHAS